MPSLVALPAVAMAGMMLGLKTLELSELWKLRGMNVTSWQQLSHHQAFKISCRFPSYSLRSTLQWKKMFWDVLKAGRTTISARTASILYGMNHRRFWKHSFDILVHVDLIASHHCCRWICCTLVLWIPHSTTSLRCSIWFRSGDRRELWSSPNSLW